MWIILKNAEEVTLTYQQLAQTRYQLVQMQEQAVKMVANIENLQGRIAALEIENETLLREVDHWKAKAQFNKDKVANHD
jgi:hypothetical protein